MIVPSHTNFGCAASLATLDKLVPPVAPPIGDTSLTHVTRLEHIQLRHQRLKCVK
jgi:hypothetical protein